MHNTFLSVVLIADAESTPSSIARDVQGIAKYLLRQFSEKEIVVVQNGASYELYDALLTLPPEAKAITQIIQLARTVPANIAYMAGLEHSHGQWTVLLTPNYANQPQLAVQLYQQASQQGADIITLQPQADGLWMRSMQFLNNGFGKLLRLISSVNSTPALTADGIFSSRALAALIHSRNKALQDLPLAYAQLGLAGNQLAVASWVGLNWRDAVEVFFTNWRRLLRGNFIRYAVLLHSAIVFAYAWLTTLNAPELVPSPYGDNANIEILKAIHGQNIVQAWLWFAVSLGLIGIYRIHQRLRQLPDESPYLIQRVLTF